MAFSLYAATIPSYQQILGAVSGLLGTAETFCAEKGIAPQDIIQAPLADDMQPFAYQVKSTAVHSLGAIEGVRRGVFSPDVTRPPDNFAALKAEADRVLQEDLDACRAIGRFVALAWARTRRARRSARDRVTSTRRSPGGLVHPGIGPERGFRSLDAHAWGPG